MSLPRDLPCEQWFSKILRVGARRHLVALTLLNMVTCCLAYCFHQSLKPILLGSSWRYNPGPEWGGGLGLPDTRRGTHISWVQQIERGDLCALR